MSIKQKSSLFRDMLYLQEVIIRGQINAVAQKNGIKASNLSTILKNLEAIFGKPLLNRNSRGIEPTFEAVNLINNFDKIHQMFCQFSRQIMPANISQVLNLYLPENLKIRELETFCVSNNQQINICFNQNMADVIVSYSEPNNVKNWICTENTIGQNIQQSIWVCCINQETPIQLAQFIIAQLHAQ